MMPNFQLHYNQGYTALRIKHDALQQGLGSELLIHEEIQQQQNRAYENLLQSALGFEPTDHSDAPPYITPAPFDRLAKAHAEHNIQPCIDFGFEPTEGCE